ncbi:MAG: DNA cytosine methyltransferase [Phycisphaerae bacterium]|nr:DNA cytosine methyltransferase [Phycisphaerae bacterium]
MMVLSLFPGVGLLDRAFEQEGFCIVRGPDVLWGGDIRRFHLVAGCFNGVIGGPPCQTFSRLANMVRHNGYQPKFGNLIPEFERCVSEANPEWFLMEEVPDAPIPEVLGYGLHTFTLNNRQLGQTQNRVRRWSFGWRGGQRVLHIETKALEPLEWEYAALGGGTAAARPVPIKIGGNGKLKRVSRLPFNNRGVKGFQELCRKQGLPPDFDLPGFTVVAKCQAVGNGVPLAMGRAMARAVLGVLAVKTKD